MQFFDVVCDLFQSGKNRETAIVRVLAIEDVESYDGVGATFFEIAVGHGDLVEIGEQCDAAIIEL